MYDGHGEFAFGRVEAGMDLEYVHTIVFFRWAGFDEGDEVTGSGSAETDFFDSLLERFRFYRNRETALTLCFVAIPNGKVDPLFLELL